MSETPASNWHFSIYVPETAPPAVPSDDLRVVAGNEQHADGDPDILTAPLIKAGNVVTVKGTDVQSQWSETVTGLMETVGNWSKIEAGKWEVSEMTVGLTLSAEGKLLFIAKGSAEASVEIKLTRKQAGTTPGT